MRRRSGVGWGHRAFAAVVALLTLPATSSPPSPTETAVTEALRGLELKVSVRYWEGAVTLRGVRNGVPIAGRGYVELTGYASAK